jgi:hypothetical protein
MDQPCPRSMQRNRRGSCGCPKHLPKYDARRGECVTSIACPSNLVLMGGRCKCPQNAPKWNGTRCIDPASQCKSNLRWTRKGCKCPPTLPKWTGTSCAALSKPGRRGRVVFEILEDTFQGVEYDGRPLLDSIREWTSRASAVYNKYTRLDITAVVSYGAGVPTAEAGWNWGTGKGDIRFGASRGYCTLLHEFAHVVLSRYTDQWNALRTNNIWTGPRVNQVVKKFDGPDATMGCDHMHFWPYQFNQDHEYFAGADVRHAIILQAFYDDITGLLCPGKTWNPSSNSCV